MAVPLLHCLATTEALSELFSDFSVLQAMLHFESALARAEAQCGVIPHEAAQAITDAAWAANYDASRIASEAFPSATPVIPLVNHLTQSVRESDSSAAGFVHWGTTSQDVADTALVLLLKRARDILDVDDLRLAAALKMHSTLHAGSPMLSRTLLQAAPPVTFGLKAAGWYASISRSWRRIQAAFDEALILQFGGACGTLAALGERGPAVAEALAKELGLRNPPAPWHAHRDRMAALITACAVYVGCLGKMARDIALLMQQEIGEVSEPGGGSSAMPHKRNPSGCVVALAAANRMPGLAASFLSGMIQEHERAAGAWQAEWPVIADAIQTTGAALQAITKTVEGLHVFPGKMRANIDATGGAVFAERVMMTLASKHGKQQAREMVERTLAQGRKLTELVPGADNPEDYLGSAEFFRKRLLEE